MTDDELRGQRPLEVFPCSVLTRQGYGEAFKWMAHYMKWDSIALYSALDQHINKKCHSEYKNGLYFSETQGHKTSVQKKHTDI